MIGQLRLCVALTALLGNAVLAHQQRPQVPGAIRSSVVLVPVDVRVLDRKGNPVTDLTQADFTVLEDGVPQRIGHFSEQRFQAVPEPVASAGPKFRRGPWLETAPETSRTFLIILGRGRLQFPARGLDAVRALIRSHALPQDLIALQAYGRLTDFTTERESLIRMVDLYEQHHERLEGLLNHWFQGPWSFDPEASPGIERKIQAFFELPGMPAVRRLPLIDVNDESPFEQSRRNAREAQMWTLTGRTPERDFVYEPAGQDDAEKLYGAIEYLRYFEGEKHVVYVSEKGLLGGRGIDVDVMAAKAADARVTVSTIRTGGVETSWARTGRGMAFMGPPAATSFANADARALAEQTGGVASAYAYASDTLNKLERATRFHYVIGYYPANRMWDGARRRIEVRVNRPGVTVLHRGSYFGREDLVPFDRRAFLTHSRVTGASAYRVLLKDVGVEVSASAVSEKRDAWQVRAEVAIDPATIAFEQVDGLHIASLDVALFAGDRHQRQIGEIRRRADLKLAPAAFDRACKEGLKFKIAIDVSRQPRYLKAVVYDYAGDKLGSALTAIQ